jgi:hypothetical protein
MQPGARTDRFGTDAAKVGPPSHVGRLSLRTLLAVYEQVGRHWTDRLLPIAEAAMRDCGGTPGDAREALQDLLQAGCLQMTAGFESGLLTPTGIHLAENLRR